MSKIVRQRVMYVVELWTTGVCSEGYGVAGNCGEDSAQRVYAAKPWATGCGKAWVTGVCVLGWSLRLREVSSENESSIDHEGKAGRCVQVARMTAVAFKWQG